MAERKCDHAYFLRIATIIFCDTGIILLAIRTGKRHDGVLYPVIGILPFVLSGLLNAYVILRHYHFKRPAGSKECWLISIADTIIFVMLLFVFIKGELNTRDRVWNGDGYDHPRRWYSELYEEIVAEFLMVMSATVHLGLAVVALHKLNITSIQQCPHCHRSVQDTAGYSRMTATGAGEYCDNPDERLSRPSEEGLIA
ncbi:hypothetical protein K469DRAFT_709627 [Zopfia rhizophila CBS 207.26]|uniref:Uncharacterized protein n=1 Tax=Zopfia rhizophila CBS 207.26 TaxID=1314779 RepID=A0A6A6ESF8_9PEZI|nr:hypothetical protein K469DRAFT_709627 [Zopfia rhizophila CBS 207.26]